MARLKSFRTTPPGGWVYRQDETHLEIKAENGDALVSAVIAHRQYKGLSPTDRDTVLLEIERQICTRLGLRECKSEGKEDAWVPRDDSKPLITMTGMLAFSKAAIAFVASGLELAPMEVVKERAEGCLRCPLNQPVVGCSCDVFYKAIEAAVPKSRRIDGLNLCMACSCSLQAKVNLTEAQIIASNEGRDIKWPAQQCFQAEAMRKHEASKASV
jgi:hypothetical protein